MTAKQTRNREFQLTNDALLDQMIDGKIVDAGEMYDRFMLAQQLSIILSIPAKQAPKRVR
jgi:hypothetical protein